ncbi:Fc.00g088340.m01.CDS01 [Cosmosporella sp. VM-42]
MPLGFKDRGGRLQAFARGSTDTNGNTNGNQNTNGITNGNTNGVNTNGVNGTQSQSPEKRPERRESQIAVPASVKREMVETAQFPMTKTTGRFTAPALRRENSISHPPHISSPKLSPGSPPRIRARANSEDHHGGLFSGSQLGESFMNSGLTTPQNEPPDPMDVAPARTQSPKKSFSPQQSPDRKQLLRPTRKSNGASFVLRDDGFMTVVTGGGSRHNSSHMKDGFQDGAVNGAANGTGRGAQYFPDDEFRIMSPAPREAQLPVREVSIRRSYARRAESYDAKDSPRTSSPTLDAAIWETQHRKDDPRRTTVFHDLDEDLNSRASDDDELQTTPKAKKSKPAPRPTLMESSMPATNGLSKLTNDRKRRRPVTDYDDMALSSMSYTELQKQPFDFDPSTVAEQNGLMNGADNLDARLEQFRLLGENEQRRFFSGMSIDDWETSGEWFVNKFAGFMQGMREARQHKRRIIQEFEWEAATREEAVRLRSEAIDRKLAKMKQNGQKVVEDTDI